MSGDLWKVCELDDGLVLKLHAGAEPALLLTQGENRVGVGLHDIKAVVGALVDAAADLAEVLASGGVYHA